MLVECVQSVAQLHLAEYEILIADDASTDDTPEVARSLAAKNPRIRYHRQKSNLGALGNASAGLALARGQYLTHLPDDDWSLPGHYEKKVALLDAFPHIGFVYSMAYTTDKEGHRTGMSRGMMYPGYSYIGGRDEFLDLLGGNYIPLPTVVFRRELYERFGWQDETFDPVTYADWELWLRYSSHTQTAFLNEMSINLRFHSGTLTDEGASESPRGLLAVWRRWLVGNEQPPTIDHRLWQRMHDLFHAECLRGLGTDPEQMQHHLAQFEQLKSDYLARMTMHFATLTRGLGEPAVLQGSAASRPAVIWTAPFSDDTLYSREMHELARALIESSLPVRLEEVRWTPDSFNDNLIEPDPLFRELAWKSVERNQPYVRVWFTPPALFRPDPGAVAVIGCPIGGADTITSSQVAQCNVMDWIWVSSECDAEAFAAAGVDAAKLRVLPRCVDVDRFAPNGPTLSLETGRSFNFLSTIESDREGDWQHLLTAWAHEFEAGEDVALVLVMNVRPGSSMEQLSGDIQRYVAASVGSRALAPVRLSAPVPAGDELAALYRSTQAYVQPAPLGGATRSLLQSMAVGLPTIAVRCKVHQAFMTDQNSYLVEPSAEHLRLAMRQVFRDRAQAAARAAQGRSDIVARHQPAAVANRLLELYEEASAKG
jgi:glycosyltransferase involved in cell wall biosynthesis